MFRHNSGLILSGILLAAVASSPAQNLQLQSIQFVGDPEYSSAELMKAAGLTPGEGLSAAEIKQAAQKLMDTGVLAGLAYKFDGQTLTFQITPAPLFPARLENLPLTPGPDLDAKLRAALPLYHGQIPADGALLTGVCTALQQQLSAAGISATVSAVPFSDPALHKITAMSFTVTSPSILIGDIQIQGVDSLPEQARAVLSQVVGSPYDREGSAQAIQSDLARIFRDEGYLAAAVHVDQSNSFAISPAAVRIPFRARVDTGKMYKVTAIRLAPGLLVTQADFDKQANTHPGDPANAVHIRENWHFIERQYHNHGYMKATVNVTPTLDAAQNTVSYQVNVVPGPIYTMGTLTVQNVSDELRNEMLSAWHMQPGAVFNEGAILGFFATHGVNTRLERVFATVNVKYVLNLHDDTHTVDVALRLERKS